VVATRSRFSQLVGDLTYWPQHNSRSFMVLARRSLWQAVSITLLNLRGTKRLVRVNVHGVDVWLRTGTPDLIVAIESLGHEFQPVIERHGHLARGGLIIDAGGYIGTVAMKFAAAFPECNVLTIEPSSDNLDVLRRNVAAYPNITIIHAALAATERTIELRNTGRREWGYSILGDTGRAVPGLSIESVPTVTIGGLMESHRADRLFLLKLDVEGAEVEILGGSANWMARTEILVAELHERHIAGAEAAFEAATGGRSNELLPGEKVISVRR
jgi:FkbM family methyltransferase